VTGRPVSGSTETLRWLIHWPEMVAVIGDPTAPSGLPARSSGRLIAL